MKKPSKCAVHEISHALVAKGLGCKIKEVCLIDEETGYAESAIRKENGLPYDKVIISSISIAGWVSEILWFGADENYFPDDDLRSLQKIGTTGIGVALIRVEVEKYLKMNKKLIFTLARELDKKKRLTGRMISRIVNKENKG